mgnify:CR=1 FL=1
MAMHQIIQFSRKLKNEQWASRESIKTNQNKKLQELILHAYHNVEYYKELFDKHSIDPLDIKTVQDLSRVPILSKDQIRANHDKIISDNFKDYSVRSYSTGGSTGKPLQFYRNVEPWSMQWASSFRAWEWYGVKRGDKIFTLGGSSLVAGNGRFSRKHFWDRYILNNRKFSSSELSDENLKHYYLQFCELKPKIIRGYPSAIYAFAKYIQNNHLKIPKIKVVLTTSETLLKEYRRVIQEVFRAPLYDSYGAGDGGGAHRAVEADQVVRRAVCPSNPVCHRRRQQVSGFNILWI